MQNNTTLNLTIPFNVPVCKSTFLYSSKIPLDTIETILISIIFNGQKDDSTGYQTLKNILIREFELNEMTIKLYVAVLSSLIRKDVFMQQDLTIDSRLNSFKIQNSVKESLDEKQFFGLNKQQEKQTLTYFYNPIRWNIFKDERQSLLPNDDNEIPSKWNIQKDELDQINRSYVLTLTGKALRNIDNEFMTNKWNYVTNIKINFDEQIIGMDEELIYFLKTNPIESKISTLINNQLIVDGFKESEHIESGPFIPVRYINEMVNKKWTNVKLLPEEIFGQTLYVIEGIVLRPALSSFIYKGIVVNYHSYIKVNIEDIYQKMSAAQLHNVIRLKTYSYLSAIDILLEKKLVNISTPDDVLTEIFDSIEDEVFIELCSENKTLIKNESTLRKYINLVNPPIQKIIELCINNKIEITSPDNIFNKYSKEIDYGIFSNDSFLRMAKIYEIKFSIDQIIDEALKNNNWDVSEWNQKWNDLNSFYRILSSKKFLEGIDLFKELKIANFKEKHQILIAAEKESIKSQIKLVASELRENIEQKLIKQKTVDIDWVSKAIKNINQSKTRDIFFSSWKMSSKFLHLVADADVTLKNLTELEDKLKEIKEVKDVS